MLLVCGTCVGLHPAVHVSGALPIWNVAFNKLLKGGLSRLLRCQRIVVPLRLIHVGGLRVTENAVPDN